MGLSKIAPPSTSVRGVHSEWLRCSEELPSGGVREDPCRAARSHLRSRDANFWTRSALAVLPGFDGLHHLAPSRFIAPWCRSWGSPGCSFSNLFVALSRGWPALTRRSTAWPSPGPRGGLVWTSLFWFEHLFRRSGVHAVSATGCSDGCVGIPTGAPPFEAFPLSAAGAASTVLATASRSSPESPGKPGASFPCGTLQSSGAGHRGPCPLAVVLDSCAPSGCHSQANGSFLDCRDRSLDLKALVHRQVRCDTPTFPSICRPMLPWASFHRGFACVLRRSFAGRDAEVPKHPTDGHRSVLVRFAVNSVPITPTEAGLPGEPSW